MTSEASTAAQPELSPATRNAFMQVVARHASISNLLRILGAGVLVTSVSMFLFKGWGSGNDVDRYVLLLVHTVLLAVTGVLVGKWVKESKGARLFLALSLVSTVVNFAVLGGLIYSQLQWDHALGAYPSFAHWQADSLRTALTTAGIAVLALIPVALLSFMALARRSASRLTVLFVLSASALLLPVRYPEAVAAVVGGLTLLLLVQIVKAKKADNSLATYEGRFARLILFASPVVLVGRSAYLYSADVIMVTVIGGLVYLGLRQLSLDHRLSDRLRGAVDAASVIPALVASSGLSMSFVQGGWLSLPAFVPVFVLGFAAILIELSFRARGSGSAVYRRLASAVVVAGMMLDLALYPTLGTALACSLSGALVMVYGYTFRRRVEFMGGVVALLAGALYQCYLAFEVFDLGSWSALATMGVLAIVAGSVLERHGLVIKARLSRWQRSVHQRQG